MERRNTFFKDIHQLPQRLLRSSLKLKPDRVNNAIFVFLIKVKNKHPGFCRLSNYLLN